MDFNNQPASGTRQSSGNRGFLQQAQQPSAMTPTHGFQQNSNYKIMRPSSSNTASTSQQRTLLTKPKPSSIGSKITKIIPN